MLADYLGKVLADQAQVYTQVRSIVDSSTCMHAAARLELHPGRQ